MSAAVLKSNLSERTPPKFYNASKDFDCTFFLVFFNSHSKYSKALLQEVTRLCEGKAQLGGSPPVTAGVRL